MTPDKIVNAKSVENALRVLLALGGSTNAIIHLTAIAGRAGVKVTLDQLNKLSDTTPVLVNLKPVGNGYMEDFFAAGGMGALLRELKPLLHLDCLTVTGETLGERLAADADGYVDRTIIAARDKPFEPQGGLVALFGNLAPKGAILKRSAADAKLFEHEGRAVVFSSLADLAARIDDPDARRERPTTSWCCRTPGRMRRRRCPRPAICRSRRSSRRAGVKDMVRVSDARMSGTAFGTIVLHVTPDAASGGPLGARAQRRPHPAVGEGAPHRAAGRRRRADEARAAAAAGRRRSRRAAMPSSTRERDPRRRRGLRFRIPAGRNRMKRER